MIFWHKLVINYRVLFQYLMRRERAYILTSDSRGRQIFLPTQRVCFFFPFLKTYKMDIEEIEGVKTYILSLCSAIGGLEEVIEADGTVGQVYCPGDEALGKITTHVLQNNN